MGFKANVIKKKYGVTVILKDQMPRTLIFDAESDEAARLHIQTLSETDPEYADCRVIRIAEVQRDG